MSGRDSPVTFDALIDHGSFAVLISEEYVLKLGLHCKHLLEPYYTELVMESNKQRSEEHTSELQSPC